MTAQPPLDDFDAETLEETVSIRRHPARTLIVTALQFIGCGLVVWLVICFHLVDFSLLSSLLEHPVAIAIVFALSLTTVPLAAFRWYLLLRAQAVDVRFLATLRVTAIVVAGNALILGGIGGEVARIAFAVRQDRGKRAAALTSIVIDRVLAMLGVLVVGGLAVPFLVSAIAKSPILSAGAVFLLGGLAAATVAITVAIVAVGLKSINGFVETFVRPHSLARTILHTMDAVACYRMRWRVLIVGGLLSTANAMVAAASLFILCATLPAPSLGFAGFAFATSIAQVANLLPIAPGGLGVGEGVFAQVCALLTASAAAQYGAIFLGTRAISTLAFLLGLVATVGHGGGSGIRRR